MLWLTLPEVPVILIVDMTDGLGEGPLPPQCRESSTKRITSAKAIGTRRLDREAEAKTKSNRTNNM